MNSVAAPVLRLHGYAVSNYFNIAHAALLESGAAFEIVECRASQTPAFLQMNPMGKIPVLETPDGWVAETIAILAYIEACFEHTRPVNAFERARQLQLINVVQLYVELPMRSLYPGVFMGGENSESAIAAARQTLDRSTAALRQLARPQPWLAGEQVGHVDLFTFYCLDLAERVSRHVYQRSLLQELGLSDWAQRMAQRPSSLQVLGAFAEVFGSYLAEKQAAYPFPAEDLNALRASASARSIRG
ncbi:MAG: glutathione S-transferase family protein [Pseudomonas sp.]